MSRFGFARSADSQCSSSTWKWVRDMHSRIASSTSVVRHVWFSFSISARGKRPSVGSVVDSEGYDSYGGARGNLSALSDERSVG